MDGVVIDERRIHVDFSQSVAKLWYNFKKAQNLSTRNEDKNNELILPNENQKLEIKANKEFMVNKGNYKMLFDEPEENDKPTKIKDKTNKKEKKEKKEHRKKSRSRSHHKDKHKHKHKHRSRSRSHRRKN